MNERYKKYKELFEQIKNIFNQSLLENKLTSKINFEKKYNINFINQCNNVILEYPEFQKLTYLIKAICLNNFPKKCKNENCNNYLYYTSTYINKYEYCSFSCAHQSKEVQEKTKQTMLSKYGVVSPLKVKEFLDKAKQTSLEHYGVEFPSQSKEFQNRVKQTNVEKYGVEYIFQSKEMREKSKQTSLKKYGVENPMQCKEVKDRNKQSKNKNIKIAKVQKTQKLNKNNKILQNNIEKTKSISPLRSPEVREKIKQTNLKKYGSISPFGSPEVREKIKQTILKKYGSASPGGSPKIKEKIKQTNLKKYGVEFPLQSREIFDKTHFNRTKNQLEKIKDIGIKLNYEFLSSNYSTINATYKWKHLTCGNEFECCMHQTKTFKLSSYIPYCPVCFPHNKSKLETEIYNFIVSIFKGDILKNDRQLIKPYELDIVIPEKRIAVEFNGTYWHSTQFGVNNNYHLMKTELCEKVDYKLIHIFEHEWISKQEIVKEKLKAILGINQKKIYARKCTIKEIETKEKNEFLNKYHIQGEDKSKIKLGLFYENELVACMTFGKPRFNQHFNWELIRYATKSGNQVLGGAGKLLSYFRKNYSGTIITYADRRFSQGNMYKKLGFTLLHCTQPNYWWIKNNEILSRYQTQKHKLQNILKKFDNTKSEFLNMTSCGYYQLFDCGNLIYSIN